MLQKINKTFLVVGVVGILTVVALLAWRGFASASLSSRFGKMEIRLPDGSRLYAKRESWGLHTQRLSVSQNPDPCVPADPKTDYINDDADAIIYSVHGWTVHIYQMPPPFSFSAPESWRGNRPDFVNADDWWSLYHQPKQVDAVALDVPLNAFCLSHFWSPVSSLRPH